MSNLKKLTLAAVTASALMAFVGASAASATTLEVGGTAKNESVSISSSLASGTSTILKNTSGSIQNTCTTSSVAGASESPYTNRTGTARVGGAVTTLSWTNCTRSVTVHAKGRYAVAWESGTNGTVYSSDAEITVGAPLVGYLTCVTSSEGTQIGKATGVSSGNATIHINANLNCGISGVWEGTYSVTSPSGLGVVE